MLRHNYTSDLAIVCPLVIQTSIIIIPVNGFLGFYSPKEKDIHLISILTTKLAPLLLMKRFNPVKVIGAYPTLSTPFGPEFPTKVLYSQEQQVNKPINIQHYAREPWVACKIYFLASIPVVDFVVGRCYSLYEPDKVGEGYCSSKVILCSKPPIVNKLTPIQSHFVSIITYIYVLFYFGWLGKLFTYTYKCVHSTSRFSSIPLKRAVA